MAKFLNIERESLRVEQSLTPLKTKLGLFLLKMGMLFIQSTLQHCCSLVSTTVALPPSSINAVVGLANSIVGRHHPIGVRVRSSSQIVFASAISPGTDSVRNIEAGKRVGLDTVLVKVRQKKIQERASQEETKELEISMSSNCWKIRFNRSACDPTTTRVERPIHLEANADHGS
ncbi:hypothetical protein PIB30_029619 [Stylosanthes scabra]|uniref:Uncharacterized protein n=1 Tax=Stylosanthes scabra TaxID=79078 RepID=A0ABU6QBN3_9FABA|nr:hypothetical protein [Stylosanthes scabra]